MALLAKLMDSNSSSGTISTRPSTSRVSNPRTSGAKPSKYSNYSSNPYGTYDDRYEKARAAGMDDEHAKMYANAKYPSVNETFWSRFGAFFGGKSAYDKQVETNLAKDDELWNSLLDSQRTFNLSSPEAEVERRQAAGLNDALNGGSEIGTGDPQNIDDQSMSGLADSVSALNSTNADFPMRIAESLMSSLGGVMNLVQAGVGVGTSLFNRDLDEIQAVFNGATQVADLGSFLPMLGFTFDSNKRVWLSDEGEELSASNLADLSFDSFQKAVSKSTGIRTSRAKKDLWSLYKSMTSPKAINSYLASLKENVELRNQLPAEMAKGIAITGGMTQPDQRFSIPEFIRNSPLFNVDTDYKVFDYYLNTSADLFKYGLENSVLEMENLKTYNTKVKELKGSEAKAEFETYSNQFGTETVNVKQRCMKAVTDLITKLEEDSKDSMFAKYLLINMMSSEFNGIGEAAMFSLEPEKPKNFGDVLDIMGDLSLFSFKQLPGLLQFFGKGKAMGPMK